MSHFGSIDEFRSALNGLINNTGRANPKTRKAKKPQRNRGRKARRNMAFPKTINHPVFGPIQVDDMEEMQAVLASAPGGGAPSPVSHTSSPPAPPQPHHGSVFGAPRPPRGGGRRGRKSLLEDVPEDFKLRNAYNAAALLLGGQGQYCPTLRAQAKKQRATLSNQKALRSMGLSPDMLFLFLDAVAQAHPEAFVTKRKRDGKPYNAIAGRDAVTAPVKASAHHILHDNFNITCPSGFAEANPYGWY